MEPSHPPKATAAQGRWPTCLILPHGVPPTGRSLTCSVVAPPRAYQVALMRSSLRVCSVGARQSAEIVASRHGPSIAPHGRTVWSKRTPSATGRSRVHSCYGEGGGDHCCAHKEYAHQADNTVAKAISAADIISNPRSGETACRRRCRSLPVSPPDGMAVSCVRTESEVRGSRGAVGPQRGRLEKPTCTSEILGFT